MAKNPAFEHFSEVQRAWNRASAARASESNLPISFAPLVADSLYSLMNDDTLRTPSIDWRARPGFLTKSRG